MTFFIEKLFVKSCRKSLPGIVTTFLFYFNFNMLDCNCQVFIFMLTILQIICTFDILKIMC